MYAVHRPLEHQFPRPNDPGDCRLSKSSHGKRSSMILCPLLASSA